MTLWIPCSAMHCELGISAPRFAKIASLWCLLIYRITIGDCVAPHTHGDRKNTKPNTAMGQAPEWSLEPISFQQCGWKPQPLEGGSTHTKIPVHRTAGLAHPPSFQLRAIDPCRGGCCTSPIHWDVQPKSSWCDWKGHRKLFAWRESVYWTLSSSVNCIPVCHLTSQQLQWDSVSHALY